MKLFKGDGQINYEDLRDIIWTLRNHSINKRPPNDNIPNHMLMAHERHIALLKQALEMINFDYQRESYLWYKLDREEDRNDKLKGTIKDLTEHKEKLELEVKALKDKMQEAQVTAGLFIQSVKEKLPNWFKKD